MNRATIVQLKAANDRLSVVTGKTYTYSPIGSGFWKFGEQTDRGIVALGDMKKLRELIAFIDAYRQGYNDATLPNA